MAYYGVMIAYGGHDRLGMAGDKVGLARVALHVRQCSTLDGSPSLSALVYGLYTVRLLYLQKISVAQGKTGSMLEPQLTLTLSSFIQN